MEWELELGRGLHVHDKRGHVHEHGRVLRTCEVGGVARLELGKQRRVWVDLRVRALLLQWAACAGLLSARPLGRWVGS